MNTQKHECAHKLCQGSPDDIKSVDELLQKSPELLGELDEGHNTPFLCAASRGNVELAKHFLGKYKAQVSLTATDIDGNNALLLAAYYGHQEMFLYLHKVEKMDLGARDCFGSNALLLTACNNQQDMLKFLLSRYPENFKLIQRDDSGKTALLLAAYYGKIEVLEYLIKEEKQSLEQTDHFGHTALMLAVCNGQIEMFQYLLDKYELKSHLQHKTPCSSTLLELAEYYQQSEMIDYLRKKHHHDFLPLQQYQPVTPPHSPLSFFKPALTKSSAKASLHACGYAANDITAYIQLKIIKELSCFHKEQYFWLKKEHAEDGVENFTVVMPAIDIKAQKFSMEYFFDKSQQEPKKQNNIIFPIFEQSELNDLKKIFDLAKLLTFERLQDKELCQLILLSVSKKISENTSMHQATLLQLQLLYERWAFIIDKKVSIDISKLINAKLPPEQYDFETRANFFHELVIANFDSSQIKRTDERKSDIFSMLMPNIFRGNRAKIIFPYNITQYHWLRGEMSLILGEDNNCKLQLYIHDPNGQSQLSENGDKITEEIITVAINRIKSLAPAMEVNCHVSKLCEAKRQHDSISSGIIIAEDIIQLANGKAIDEQEPNDPGALELRRQQLHFVNKHGNKDLVKRFQEIYDAAYSFYAVSPRLTLK